MDAETNLSAVEVLVAARKLIEKPESWTQGAYARDADGSAWDDAHVDEVRPWSANAVCRCSAGAVYGAAGTYAYQAESAFKAIAVAAGCYDPDLNDPETFVVSWNDNIARTHAEVLAAFDYAISLAESN